MLAVKDWLATLCPGDERETELNKVKYNDGVGGYCTALHFAAYKHQTQIVKLLLEEGAGMIHNIDCNIYGLLYQYYI